MFFAGPDFRKIKKFVPGGMGNPGFALSSLSWRLKYVHIIMQLFCMGITLLQVREKRFYLTFAAHPRNCNLDIVTHSYSSSTTIPLQRTLSHTIPMWKLQFVPIIETISKYKLWEIRGSSISILEIVRLKVLALFQSGNNVQTLTHDAKHHA